MPEYWKLNKLFKREIEVRCNTDVKLAIKKILEQKE